MTKRNEAWSRESAERRKMRERLKAEGRPCHICGQPIDYSLPAGDPMCFELDHVIPISRGGEPFSYENAAASHRVCNQRKGNSMPGDKGSLPIVRTRIF